MLLGPKGSRTSGQLAVSEREKDPKARKATHPAPATTPARASQQERSRESPVGVGIGEERRMDPPREGDARDERRRR